MGNEQVDKQPADLLSSYQKYSVFEPDAEFKRHIEQFQSAVTSKYERGNRLSVSVNGATAQILTEGVEITRLDTNLLMATLNFEDVWPSFDDDIQRLYELAMPLMSPIDRPAADSWRNEEIRQFGLRKWYRSATLR